jgi:ABC-type lipoprotein release transport system permease subunit
LFTQRPLKFHFDYELLLAVFCSSMAGAIIASLGPVRQVLKHSVVDVLRMHE